MKSEWRVTRNLINGKDMYAVYRLKNADIIDYAGNREIYKLGYMEYEDVAESVAKRLNSED